MEIWTDIIIDIKQLLATDTAFYKSIHHLRTKKMFKHWSGPIVSVTVRFEGNPDEICLNV